MFTPSKKKVKGWTPTWGRFGWSNYDSLSQIQIDNLKEQHPSPPLSTTQSSQSSQPQTCHPSSTCRTRLTYLGLILSFFFSFIFFVAWIQLEGGQVSSDGTIIKEVKKSGATIVESIIQNITQP